MSPRRTLSLAASPASVRLARQWITEALTTLGRPELIESAQLALTEVVTNSILHSAPPILVRMRGTAERPRIEVSDHNPDPPRLRLDTDELSTIGRGLALVAMHSVRWGSDMNAAQDGKTVWFEPHDDARPDADLSGDVYNLDDLLGEAQEQRTPPADFIPITLLGMPAQLFARLRVHHDELRREVRLCTLAWPDEFAFAEELNQAFLDAERDRRQVIGLSRLNRAVAEGVEVVDLEYAVPPEAPAHMGRILSLIEDAYSFFEEHHALVMPPPAVLSDLQRWYLTEFVRQGSGEQPMPWSGPVRIDVAS